MNTFGVHDFENGSKTLQTIGNEGIQKAAPVHAVQGLPLKKMKSGGGSALHSLNVSEDGFPIGAKIGASLGNTLGHPFLGGFEITPRVINLLVTDFTIHLQHAVVILEEVIHNRTCEGVLGIGVDVHLDHPVIQRLANFFKKASTATMKHQVHLSFSTIFGDDGGLTIPRI